MLAKKIPLIQKTEMGVENSTDGRMDWQVNEKTCSGTNL